MDYQSFVDVEPDAMPGVRLRLRKMSFGRRLELAKEIRALAGRIEFLEAGSEPLEKMSGALLAKQIDLIYLRWGVADIQGLNVDGRAATVQTFIEDGPEELVREALRAIRTQCGLTEEQRKN